MKNFIHQNLSHIKIILYIVVFIVCFGLAMSLLSINSFLPVNNKVSSQGQNALMAMSGTWMKLTTESTNVAVGDEVVFTIMADSDSVDINGFDVLFEYDPNQLQIEKVNSLIPYFDIYTFENPTYLSITGTKKLSAETTAVIENSALITVIARAKQAGAAQVRILPGMKMEKTKMVNSKAEIVMPSIGEAVTVTIN